MHIKIKGGKPTDWYSSQVGVTYRVISEGDKSYLIDTPSLGNGIRMILKDDCERISEPIENNTDAHYDNSNGSLYKFAEDHGLNAYEFDILKRITRCRKKGQFKDDLEKTKRVIDLYLREHNESME